jgi:hypothetical protein
MFFLLSPPPEKRRGRSNERPRLFISAFLPGVGLAPAAGAPAAPQGPAHPRPSKPAYRTYRSAAHRFDGREVLRRGAEAQNSGSGGCLGTESTREQHERRRRKSECNFAHDSLLMCRERIAPSSAPIGLDASRSIAPLDRSFTRRRTIGRKRTPRRAATATIEVSGNG